MSITKPLLTGNIYPDRSFSLGFCPKTSCRKADKAYEVERRNQEGVNYAAVTDWLTGVNTIEGEFVSTSESPLLVKSLKSSPKKRGAYGRHGITRFGRRFVKNAAILLQRRYGKRRLGFATATLPDMDYDTLNTINGSLSEIIRRFYQKLRRKYKKRGREFIYVGVVEIQEKRFQRTRLPVPHLHFVFLAKDRISTGYTCHTPEFYRAWNESVNEILVKSGKAKIMGIGRHRGSVKLESVRASASSYLGKYISKGCTVVKSMQEAGFDKFPKQWWNASMQMKKMFRDSIIRIDAMFAKALFYNLEYFLEEGQVTWARFIDVCIAGEDRTMGLVGTFSKEAYHCIHAN